MSVDDRTSRVFISYSHDSDQHRERVLRLSNQLREDGVDASIDRYEPFPPQGWPQWMQQQIAQATFVLVVCTETYRRRAEGTEEAGKGLGATWEAFMLLQLLYEAGAHNEKIVPVLFEGTDAEAVPVSLRAYTRFHLPAGYDQLYRLLTHQPEVRVPAVGPRKALPLLGATSAELPPPESTLKDLDLSGVWRHAGPLGLGQRLHIKKIRPFEYSYTEYFWGVERGSGTAFLDQDDWMHVKGVNTWATYEGCLRLVNASLVGEISGPKIPRFFGNVTLVRAS